LCPFGSERNATGKGLTEGNASGQGIAQLIHKLLSAERTED
jgi:hypothetical protein